MMRKDFAMLMRDKPGLATLFVMPLLLLIVIALVQDAALSAMQGSGSTLLIVCRSGGAQSSALERRLAQQAAFRADTKVMDGASAADLGAIARRGGYRAAVLLPDDLGGAIRTLLSAAAHKSNGIPEIAVWIDPAVPLSLRNGMMAEISRCVAMDESRQVLDEAARAAAALAGFGNATGRFVQPPAREPAGPYDTNFIRIRDCAGGGSGAGPVPTVTQQNVPAWAIFGMFFIVIPLSSHLITERRNGTLLRLMMAPAWRGYFLLGKVATYTLTGTVQLLVLLAAGFLVLPHLGLPALEIHSPVWLTLAGGLVAGLAASCFGLLVGLVSRSQQQASTVGAIAVVIAAALGGIMVPMFVMPPYLQAIGDLSPLSWALNLFLDLFLRQSGWREIQREVFLLLAFSGACLGIGLVCLQGRIAAGTTGAR
jgi:ABC-2 type transport system permease protein